MSPAADRASSRKRRRNAAPRRPPALTSFTATERASTSSHARHTSAVPPLATRSSSVYLSASRTPRSTPTNLSQAEDPALPLCVYARVRGVGSDRREIVRPARPDTRPGHPGHRSGTSLTRP